MVKRCKALLFIAATALLHAETLAMIKKRAAAYPTIHITSAEKAFGIDELRAEIAGLAKG